MPTEVEYGTNVKKDKKKIQYIGRDFGSIRQNLIEFAKSYYPTAYNDFNESSPGMMFIEMASYVGDMLSYYIDNQYRETLLHSAEEKKNIFKIAQSFGYKPKLSSPATAICDISVEVPAILQSNTYVPDLNYAPRVNADSLFSSKSGRSFRLMDDVNFKFSSSYDSRTEEIAKFDGETPTHFKLTKQAILESGEKATETFTFGTAKKFDKIMLAKKNVIEVTSCIDDDGNTWYQVPFLAQDTVFQDIENTTDASPDSAGSLNAAPFLLKLVKTANRFTTYVRSDGKTELRFGAGISTNADEEIIPNPDNVGSSLSTGLSKLDSSFDPSNFLKTKTFGQAPGNISLTITYTHGGSNDDNVVSGELSQTNSISFTLNETGLTASDVKDTKDSLVITNGDPATGGADGETPEQVRQNALAYFNSQNRAVTKEDYVTRVYSLPQKYGAVAKVFMVQDEQLELNTKMYIKNGKLIKQPGGNAIPNPMALNMYTLGYNANKQLVPLNEVVKNNLKTYLSQYRILTDAVNIKDAYIVNIAVRFSIITQRGFNKNEVLLKCIDAVNKHFDTDNWQIGQPIILGDIAYKISLVNGVASVIPPEDNNPQKQIVVVENKFKSSEGYSGNVYDIQAATKDGVIYTSLDPSIFELKYSNTDIEGRVVGNV